MAAACPETTYRPCQPGPAAPAATLTRPATPANATSAPAGPPHQRKLQHARGLRSSLSDLLGRLPARALSARLSDGAGPARGVQGCRTPGAPAPERGAAPPDRPGPLPAVRPAMALGTVLADSPKSMGRGVRRDPGDAARLAPAASRTPMGLHEPAVSGTAVHASRDPQARDPHRDRQPDMGTPARARRTRQARPPDRGLHGVADPARCRDRLRAPPHRPHLEAIPDHAGPRHPGGRFRPCGHRVPAAHLRPDRHRAWHTPRSPGRHHHEPGWRVDDTGGP